MLPSKRYKQAARPSDRPSLESLLAELRNEPAMWLTYDEETRNRLKGWKS